MASSGSELELVAHLTNLGVSAPLIAVYNAIADAVVGISDKIKTASCKPGMHISVASTPFLLCS